MNKMYIITGAAGHLGSTIIQYLKKTDCSIRGLILPSENGTDEFNVKYYKGDITKDATMDNIFSDTENSEIIVIHTAGLISISGEVTPILYDVNVNGTKNIIRRCFKHHVKKLLYVSSVHAIPEAPDLGVITEVKTFSKDKVIGAYAVTKAEATQAVMDAIMDGLDAVVVHPSGIIGPYDSGRNHMVQLVQDYISGKLPAAVTGGYDFVDVRDVAKGCIAAAEKGRKGETYILSNRYCPTTDLFAYMRTVTNGKKVHCIPLNFMMGIAPVFEWFGKATKTRPLFTRYSLHTMASNGRFSHDKATMELGYSPMELKQSIADTISWLKYKKCEKY